MLIFKLIQHIVSDQLRVQSDQYQYFRRHSCHYLLLPLFLFAVLPAPTAIAQSYFLLQVLKIALDEIYDVCL